jgi:tetratricopeptide (TPR) repeat protein
LAIVLTLGPRLAPATGIESAVRWIEQPREPSAKPVLLEAPEFYFELEAKRIAAELNPGVKPKPAITTADADAADFRDAIEKKLIAPPDPAQAEAAHVGTRKMIDWEAAAEKPDPATKPLEPAAEFASEFADYHRGAIAFEREGREAAVVAWKALLERPTAERHYRTVWAMYMLGRTAIYAKNWDEAHAWFAKTREAAAAGFADSLGLVAAACGWDAYAHLEQEHFAEAAKLYFAQLAGGDISAVNSLRVVMETVFNESADLAPLVSDPIFQRLGIAGAVCGMSPFSSPRYLDKDEKDKGSRLLDAIEAAGAKNVRDADRVAWIAYARGDYARAQRWLARADANAPFALWLRAKFALRDGKVDAATKLLATAVTKLPVEKEIKAYNVEGPALPPRDCAHGDLGLLRLSRSEFVAAFRLFLDGGLYSDAFYVADGVLTLEELKNFLEREGPKLPKPPAEGQPDNRVWHFYYYDNPKSVLRQILASRFVRLGRYAEARPWLDAETQPFLDEFIAQLGRAQRKGASKDEQREGYWKAAKIMIQHGSLADYFDPVSMAQRASGRVVDTGSYPEFFLKYGKPDRFEPPLAKVEQQRLKANSKPELRRHYSSYLAADLGMRSAALMPDNEDATALRLNTIGLWLKEGDDAPADRIYQAIERHCAKTDLGKAAIKRHWFVPDEEEPLEDK